MNHPVIESRLDELMHGGVLSFGAHASFDDGACAMEWVSYIAGLGHTDAPECASPVLRDFTINLNDTWGPVQRQKLVPFLPRMVGTANDGQDEARSYLALDWLIRVHTPAWFDAAGLTEDARNLRGLPEIVDQDVAERAVPVVRAARDRVATAGNAAGAAAWNAAGAASRYAARYAAGAAAITAARAAGASTVDALQPTATLLQASALELLDRMIDPSAVAA